MTISADDATSTLRYVLPGFVALTFFYWFGLATKRADWRWLLWSLLASVPIGLAARWLAEIVGDKPTDVAGTAASCGTNLLDDELARGAFRTALEGCINSALTQHNAPTELLFAIVIALLAGLAAVYLWRLLARSFPTLRRKTEPLVWGSVLREPRWLQVYVEGATYFGYTAEAADPVEVEASDLDLYLGAPQILRGEAFVPMENVEGVILRRDDIKRIEVFAPTDVPNHAGHVHLTPRERWQGWIRAERLR
jgi:hypothetical protein